MPGQLAQGVEAGQHVSTQLHVLALKEVKGTCAPGSPNPYLPHHDKHIGCCINVPMVFADDQGSGPPPEQAQPFLFFHPT